LLKRYEHVVPSAADHTTPSEKPTKYETYNKPFDHNIDCMLIIRKLQLS